MKKMKKIIPAVCLVILCIFAVLSFADTNEKVYETNFKQENILNHVDHITDNGPHSVVDKEENQKVIEYITETLESYGVVNAQDTASPAYTIQSFVNGDENYQHFYLDNVIVHIPANDENPTGEAIMTMAHFDSVPMGNGASDDAVACGVMLEAIRYNLEQMENGKTLKNDLVFCFVNGEEYGLLGSEAFMNEFIGFDNVIERINFGINLESRGTDGTLIMFETAKNNYNTVKLLSEINNNVFTCSIATMIYDMMPNGTDFSNFKEAYQGLNFANISGGENYHTQNDNLENVGMTYLSQQAFVVDSLLDKLGSYDLTQLYDADESAIFFSYLNTKIVVYNHLTAQIFAVLGIVMLIANIFLRKKNQEKGWKKTAAGIVTVFAGMILSLAVTYACYYLFQYIASFLGAIDIHQVGKITYSNMVIAIAILLIAVICTAVVTNFACKKFNLSGKDVNRGFAYIHMILGSSLSFVLADASYLFIFSGLLLMANQLLITCMKKTDVSEWHLDLLATALYFPILVPIMVLATTALGMTMAYVYGLIAALLIFNIGVFVAPRLKGVLYMGVLVFAMLLVVSMTKLNASVNLEGKQGRPMLPYDDALVYVVNADGEKEYRICDLNAYRVLTDYAPEMEYHEDGYYVGEGEEMEVTHSIRSSATANKLKVARTSEESDVYLLFTDIEAESFTVNDGTTETTYEFIEDEHEFYIHLDCEVTVNGGSATVEYKEVIRDYESLIPEKYADESEQLHFNLWLTDEYTLSK